MFNSDVYVKRRRALVEGMAARDARGIAVFLGNVDAAANYRGNDYKFRQDSNFLYYWGVDEPCFAAVLDIESGEEYLYGNDVDIDDIIWRALSRPSHPKEHSSAALLPLRLRNSRKR